MSDFEQDEDRTDEELPLPTEDPKVGWKDRVRFASGPRGPVAYRPHECLTTRPEEALAVTQRRWPDARLEIPPDGLDSLRTTEFGLLRAVPDGLDCVEELRLAGIVAQPNHVFFAHCGCCPPHPAWLCGDGVLAGSPFAYPAHANPAHANPAHANPAHANPAHANPAFANPAHANPGDPLRTTGLQRSSARPPDLGEDRLVRFMRNLEVPAIDGGPTVIVLDTGLAAGRYKPTALQTLQGLASVAAPREAEADQPDSDGNQILDGAAGHGTFIAGLIHHLAPGCKVEVRRVLNTYGDGDEEKIVNAINGLPADRTTILNLSFGGYVWDQPYSLARAIRRFQDDGGVVVASAGNDATCLESYPAALPNVVSVGAVCPTGPALFTNYGPWVRACAPGVNLLSLFFRNFRGAGGTDATGGDPDNFDGWAVWSGTSFSGPVVAAALARTMMSMPADQRSAAAAVERVIDAPALMRIPNLGTVVNIA